MNNVFILAFLLIIGGFVLSLKPDIATEIVKSQQDSTTETTNTPSVEQQTKGEKSAAIHSSGDVDINYGGTLSSQKKTTKPIPKTPPKQAPPVQLKQTTEGDQSAAIHSSGDVNINYAD